MTKPAHLNHRARLCCRPEVMTSHPASLQRPCRIHSSGCYCLLCRCAAFQVCGSLRKPQSSTERARCDGISSRYRQHRGDSDKRRHVHSDTGGEGGFAISAQLCGLIQLVAGECDALFLVVYRSFPSDIM